MEDSIQRHEPVAVDVRSSRAGLRTVATFEALKGSVVIVLLIVIIAVHASAGDLAESLLFHLHIDPDRHLAEVLVDAADRLSDTRLLTICLAAITYVSVRAVEAWGLWNRRVWAEWFALLSGGMYLPWELLKMAQHPNKLHLLVLSVNLLIVAYMLYVRTKCFWLDRRDCQTGTKVL